MSADGGFANKTWLETPPEKTALLARIRKDAKLRTALDPVDRTGNRMYGMHLPTPEKMLADESIPLKSMTVFKSGRQHTIQYKVVEDIRWPNATQERSCTLILISRWATDSRKDRNSSTVSLRSCC